LKSKRKRKSAECNGRGHRILKKEKGWKNRGGGEKTLLEKKIGKDVG